MKTAEKGVEEGVIEVKKFYVYELRDDTGKVFYVGKGTGNRMRSHRAPSNQKSRHLYNKIRKMWREGKDYTEHKVFETSFEHLALAEEIRLIAFYGKDNLTNNTIGGEGVSGHVHDAAARKKMSDSHMGKWGGDSHYSRTNPEKLARGDRSGARVHPESRPKGEKHGNAKLKGSLVEEMRRRFYKGEDLATLAEEAMVSLSVMWSAMKGKTWKHIAFPSGGSERFIRPLNLTAQVVDTIRSERAQGVSIESLALKFNLKKSSVLELVRGRLRTDVPFPEGVSPEKVRTRKVSTREVYEMRLRHMHGEAYGNIALDYGVSGMTVKSCVVGDGVYASDPFPPGWARRDKHEFSDKQILRIRTRYFKGVTQTVIARDYKVTRSVISEIVCGKAYKKAPFPKGFIPTGRNPNEKLTDEQVLEVRIRSAKGESNPAIAKSLGISRQQVRNIVIGKCRWNVGLPEGYKFPTKPNLSSA